MGQYFLDCYPGSQETLERHKALLGGIYNYICMVWGFTIYNTWTQLYLTVLEITFMANPILPQVCSQTPNLPQEICNSVSRFKDVSTPTPYWHTYTDNLKWYSSPPEMPSPHDFSEFLVWTNKLKGESLASIPLPKNYTIRLAILYIFQQLK